VYKLPFTFIEASYGGGSRGFAEHCKFLMQFLLAHFYQNVREVVHSGIRRDEGSILIFGDDVTTKRLNPLNCVI
jgi:hypothetical protein